MEQPTTQSDKQPRRAKRTPEQRIADLQASIDAERTRMDKSVREIARRAVVELCEIEKTQARVDADLRQKCHDLAGILADWLAAGKPGAG